MDLIMILGLIVITILLLEVTKHVLFKSFSKTLIMVILLVTMFFVIVATLQYNNDIDSDNPLITTGATIVESVQEEGYFDTIKEKFYDLKDTISDSFS